MIFEPILEQGHYKLKMTDEAINKVTQKIIASESLFAKLEVIVNETKSIHYAICTNHEIGLLEDTFKDASNIETLIRFTFEYYVPFIFEMNKKELHDRMADIDDSEKLDLLNGELERDQTYIRKKQREAEENHNGPNFFKGYSDRQTRTVTIETRYIWKSEIEFEQYAKGAAAWDYTRYIRAQIAGISAKSVETNEEIEQTSEATHKAKAREKLLLLKEFGLLEILIEKLSVNRNGKLNDKELSRLIAIIIGEDAGTLYKDLMHVYYNTEGSKGRPINTKSVDKVEKILLKFSMQPKNLKVVNANQFRK